MIVLLFLAVGILTDIKPGDSCEQAFHRLRSEEGLRIEATNTLDRPDNKGGVLVYTLTKGKKKSAILGCVLSEEPSPRIVPNE